jgi:uncharacterized membrane protein (UPF0127 family)
LTKVVCAFNITRQSFISLGVTIADSPLTRLRGLLGKMRMKSSEALWVVPSRGIHTIGLMFSIDVIYMDATLRVIEVVEGLAPLRLAPLRLKCASVLELPARSICESGTRTGDQLMICSPDEMERYLTSQSSEGPAARTRTGPEPNRKVPPA